MSPMTVKQTPTIAEETVKLNQAVNREGDQELAAEAEKQAAEVRARLQKIEQARF